MSKLNRMEELYRSYKNKNTPIAKSLKKIIDENKRNKPTKSAAKKGGSPTQSEETQQTLSDLRKAKYNLKDTLKELHDLEEQQARSPTATTTETDSTEPGSPASSVSSGLNSPKEQEAKPKKKSKKKSKKNTHVKQTTKGNAGRHTKSVNAYVTRSRALIGKGGRKTKKKRKHKRKTKKNNILKK